MHKKKRHQLIKYLAKAKKEKKKKKKKKRERNFSSHVFHPEDPLTSCNNSEKPYEPFLRKTDN